MPKTVKKIAAIDIGSNAMRAAFAKLSDDGHLKVFKNYRYPIRLGGDVFSKGKLTKKKIAVTEQAFQELFFKLSKHNITHVNAIATSALRDASNSKEVISKIKDQTGIKINVINGKKEAKLIKKAIDMIIPMNKKIALLIDIGGGSTELTLTRGKRIVYCQSFQYGTVRLLKSVKDHTLERDIQEFSKRSRSLLKKYLKGKEINLCVGTGGNLRRMGKLRHHIFNKPTNRMTLTELNRMYREVAYIPIHERVKRFQMREDRADVIIPAMAIVEQIMRDHDIYEILLPKIGLKEGILLDSLNKRPKELHLQIKDQ